MTGNRLLPILKWLRLANRRNRQSFSFAGNNLNYAAVAMLFMLDPAAAGMLLLIMGMIVLLPMSADPLRAIPKTRLRLWPLSAAERRLLRIVSPWLSPMTWAVVALAVWRKSSVGIVALAAGVVVTGFLAPGVLAGGGKAVWMPTYPGMLSQLIRKNLRQMTCTLDFCCGALITALALLWLAMGQLPEVARFPLTAVALLCLSTCALTLFGLDGPAGMTRYRLMPLRGWQILLAKDVAFLTITFLVAAPLSWSGALAGALTALAIGHRASVRTMRVQTRWRFQTGPSLGDALAQIIPMIGVAAAVVNTSALLLIPAAVACGVSLWWFGRELDNALR